MLGYMSVQPVDLETRQAQEARDSFNLKQDKLKAIDKLLWDTDFVDAGIAHQQSSSGDCFLKMRHGSNGVALTSPCCALSVTLLLGSITYILVALKTLVKYTNLS